MKTNRSDDFVAEVKKLVSKYGLSSRDGHSLAALRLDMKSCDLELDYADEQPYCSIEFYEKKHSDTVNYTRQKFGQWLDRSKRMGAVHDLLIERADASVAQFLESNFLKYGEEFVTHSNVSNAESIMCNRQIKSSKSNRFAVLLTLIDTQERIYSFGNNEKLNDYLSLYANYLDAHDIINLVQFKTQVQCCREELSEISSDDNSCNLPPELCTPQAMILWKRAQDKGWVDEKFKPLITQKKAAVVASVIVGELKLNPKWKAIESFWGIKDLANKLSQSIIATKYYPDFLIEVQRALL